MIKKIDNSSPLLSFRTNVRNLIHDRIQSPHHKISPYGRNDRNLKPPRSWQSSLRKPRLLLMTPLVLYRIVSSCP